MLQTSSKSVSAAIGNEEQQSKTPCSGSGDEDLSEKMVTVEGDDDSWTVDCLRRRLVAERVSSRVAKEDAELMGRKLIELESQLKLEIKARNRAEKMLKFATKKLESLNISAALGQSSSPASEGSVSSSTCSSSPQEPDGSSSSQKETRKSNTEEKIKNEADSLLSEDFRCKNSATAGADAVNQEPCYEQGSSSADAANFHNNEGGSVEDVNEFKDSLSSRELTTDAFRQSSPGEEVKQKQDQMEYADNALAIVPVNMWPESKNNESQINNITDVLIALQRAKEHLQSSIGIRSSACSKSVRLSGMYRDVLLPD
ncbi:hypothetical protein AAC387_Pa07g3421 [Persea americana]